MSEVQKIICPLDVPAHMYYFLHTTFYILCVSVAENIASLSLAYV